MLLHVLKSVDRSKASAVAEKTNGGRECMRFARRDSWDVGKQTVTSSLCMLYCTVLALKVLKIVSNSK